MDSNEKTIWITGASSGIGKALVEKYAEKGWKVAASARRENLLNEMSKHENIFSYPLDVTQKDSIENAFKNILRDFKELNICIFCSGTYERKSEKELSPENIKKVFDVNFLGVVNSVSIIEKYFKERRKGHIGIVSSPVGYRGLPNSTGYSPSKAALNNFTQGIYFDFKKFNVMITLISPGFIKTALTDKNDFKMPYLKSTNFAADKIFEGMKKKQFEIIFPYQIAFIYKIFQILPNKIYNYLISKFINK